MTTTLTRELRFGLQEPADTASPKNSGNGFAANPALTGIAPFVLLRASIAGPIDRHTGMLINIKIVDQLLRQHAIPYLQTAIHPSIGNRKSNIENLLPPLHKLLAPLFSPNTLTALTLAPSPYLAFTVHKENPTMVRLSLRFEFSAAHRLYSDTLSEQQNTETFGRCTNANGHGHNYELEVTIAGIPSPSTGEILPIPTLQQIVNETILDRFDHKHLNLDCPEFHPATGLNPTVENIAKVIYQKLKPTIPAPTILQTIRVWETPKTMCEYSE